jgi:hypothetical protein
MVFHILKVLFIIMITWKCTNFKLSSIQVKSVASGRQEMCMSFCEMQRVIGCRLPGNYQPG